MKTISRNINVSALHPAQQIRVQFVVAMEELILTDKFWKENLVCLKWRLPFFTQELAVSIGNIFFIY
jgi:hypothetical protein